jgi:heme/copper-type cytochrome/quinol oxidase subunit 4
MNDPEILEKPGPLSKYTVSFGISLGVTSIVNALLVIAKETNKTTILVWMKRATGHDWATQALLSVILFLSLGLALTRGQGPKMTSAVLVQIIVAGVFAGGLIIAGFFLLG